MQQSGIFQAGTMHNTVQTTTPRTFRRASSLRRNTLVASVWWGVSWGGWDKELQETPLGEIPTFFACETLDFWPIKRRGGKDEPGAGRRKVEVPPLLPFFPSELRQRRTKLRCFRLLFVPAGWRQPFLPVGTIAYSG